MAVSSSLYWLAGSSSALDLLAAALDEGMAPPGAWDADFHWGPQATAFNLKVFRFRKLVKQRSRGKSVSSWGDNILTLQLTKNTSVVGRYWWDNSSSYSWCAGHSLPEPGYPNIPASAKLWLIRMWGNAALCSARPPSVGRANALSEGPTVNTLGFGVI